MSLETLEHQHERGGSCDKRQDALWAAIRKVEGDVVNERIELVKLSTKIAIYTGLICGIPGLALLIIEMFKH